MFVTVREARREVCIARISNSTQGCELNGLRKVRIEVVAAKRLGIASRSKFARDRIEFIFIAHPHRFILNFHRCSSYSKIFDAPTS